jgi:hypothetical protein
MRIPEDKLLVAEPTMRLRICNLLIAISLCSLCGCMVLESDVTSFHNFGTQSSPSGSIWIIPAEGMPESLEFSAAATRVYSFLQPKGLVRAKSAASADYVGKLAYGMEGASTSSMPIFGRTGGGTALSSGTIYSSRGSASYIGSSSSPASFGIVGAMPLTQHMRLLTLVIANRRTGEIVWEGRNRSKGSSGEIAKVLPRMIEAMLKDFPNESGKTRFVSLPLP